MNFHNLSQRASKAARLLRSGTTGSSTTIAERVEHLNTLDVSEAATALLAMPQAKAVAILDRPELHGAAAIIAHVPVEQAARFVNLMSDDRVADVMAEMEEEPRAKLFSRLDRTTALSIKHLMGYPPRTAGSIMTTEFVSVPDDWTVEQTLSHIRVVERSRETVYAIYVLAEDGTLSTVVTLRRLVTGEPGASILSVASKEGIVCASPLMSQEDVARLIRKHDLLALPVVDDRSHILGIVTVDDVIDTMIADTTEDAHKFGGMEALGKPYMTIGFPDMIRKRAGWLAALFLGEMLTASAMQHFEGELEKAVVLTLFIPLALGELKLSDWWRVLLREIPTGLTLGCILGAIGFLRLTVWQQAGFYDYGEHWLLVGATVFAALVGIVTFGSLAGSMLPFVLQRLRLDPASASAPFVATLVDVSGLVIYFSVALVILSGTLL
jgi:magnesium transporter